MTWNGARGWDAGAGDDKEWMQEESVTILGSRGSRGKDVIR